MWAIAAAVLTFATTLNLTAYLFADLTRYAEAKDVMALNGSSKETGFSGTPHPYPVPIWLINPPTVG
jgi:hypothetical protein